MGCSLHWTEDATTRITAEPRGHTGALQRTAVVVGEGAATLGRNRASLRRRQVGDVVIGEVLITSRLHSPYIFTTHLAHPAVVPMPKVAAVCAGWWWRWQSQAPASPSIVALGTGAAERPDGINTSPSIKARMVPCQQMARM